MWLLTGANGYSFDAGRERFDAVVVNGARIAAVGTVTELRQQFGRRVEREVDVGGATVIPGLVDSHLHLAAVGEQALALDLTGVRDQAELFAAVRSHAAGLPADAWVVGSGWDDNRLPGGWLPTPAQLDDAAGGRPLWLTRVCRHAYLANQAAFARVGLGHHPKDPEDGRFGRDASGELNGWVYENASRAFARAIPQWTKADWERALKLGMQTALRAGITAVHTDDTRNVGGFAATWRIYRQLIHERGMRLRIHGLVDWHYLQEASDLLADEHAGAAVPRQAGFVNAGVNVPYIGGGDTGPRSYADRSEWIEVGAAKLFADGAFGGRTAWLSAPYSDAPNTSGTPMYTTAQLTERVQVARQLGFPAAIHSIGDAGLDAALTALEQAGRPGPGLTAVARDRIIHAELTRPDLLERLAQLGNSVAVDVQPRFVCSDFPWVENRLGPLRSPWVGAWRRMLCAGLHLAGGSDAPIEPVSPLLGAHAAVTRWDPNATGMGYGMQEALTPREALQLFTVHACFANGSEGNKGVLAPGRWADMTVVDRDVVAPRHPDDIRDARVVATIVGGEFAYQA